RNLIIGLSGVVVTAISGYGAIRGVLTDASWGGPVMFFGAFLTAIGATASVMALASQCCWSSPKAKRDIYKLVQDTTKMRTFSLTLATGEIDAVSAQLDQYPYICKHDLTDFNIVKDASAENLFFLVDLYRTTCRSVATLKDETLTTITNLWQRLRQTIADE